MKITLFKNYLGFINRIRSSTKPVLQQLFKLVKGDDRTVTGANLRNILLLTDCMTVDDLTIDCIKQIKYNEMMEQDRWRTSLIKEVLDMKHGSLAIPIDWSVEDLEEIMNYACTQ